MTKKDSNKFIFHLTAQKYDLYNIYIYVYKLYFCFNLFLYFFTFVSINFSKSPLNLLSHLIF